MAVLRRGQLIWLGGQADGLAALPRRAGVRGARQWQVHHDERQCCLLVFQGWRARRGCVFAGEQQGTGQHRLPGMCNADCFKPCAVQAFRGAARRYPLSRHAQHDSTPRVGQPQAGRAEPARRCFRRNSCDAGFQAHQCCQARHEQAQTAADDLHHNDGQRTGRAADVLLRTVRGCTARQSAPGCR